jgi:hypothetical protein
MLVLFNPEFHQLFREASARAFHLETKDSYTTPEEAEPLRKWLAGEPDTDTGWYSEWDELVATTCRRGVKVQRVRVVTVPHTDYTRWLLATSETEVAAGEDIRWLPRHLTVPDDYTSDDWWLFDDTRLGYTLFDREGRFAGLGVTDDPVLLARARRVRDTLWERAIRHADYVRGDADTRR